MAQSSHQNFDHRSRLLWGVLFIIAPRKSELGWDVVWVTNLSKDPIRRDHPTLNAEFAVITELIRRRPVLMDDFNDMPNYPAVLNNNVSDISWRPTRGDQFIAGRGTVC